MPSRRLVVPALLATSLLAFAGCAATPTEDDGRPHVVASTAVYAQIVEAIGGDLVDVAAIITSEAQDPHEFEPSARDQLTVQKADLVIENGGGYDAFIDALLEASGSAAPVLTAVEFSAHWPGESAQESDEHGDHHDHDHQHEHVEGVNEHVWYDLAAMSDLAAGIASKLEVLLPDDAATFAKNLDAFRAGIQSLQGSLADISKTDGGAAVFVTEPLPLGLTEAAGFMNSTPAGFSEAVEEGNDVAPAILLEALKIVPQVAVVITNAQAAGAETERITQAADDAGVPVARFSEMLPASSTYLEWMQHNVDELAEALAG